MKTERGFEQSQLEKTTRSIEQCDRQIEEITAQIREIELNKKAAEEALAVETDRLRLKESELKKVIDLKEVQKIYRTTLHDERARIKGTLVTDKVTLKSYRKGTLTPYKIRCFGLQRTELKKPSYRRYRGYK